jgi:hypothetical protein
MSPPIGVIHPSIAIVCDWGDAAVRSFRAPHRAPHDERRDMGGMGVRGGSPCEGRIRTIGIRARAKRRLTMGIVETAR